jgi:hypothetical protein
MKLKIIILMILLFTSLAYGKTKTLKQVIKYSYTVRNASSQDVVTSDKKKVQYTYNRKGQLQEIITYDNDGKVSSRETYKYNKKDVKVEVLTFDADSNIVYKATYNDSGQETEIVFNGSYFSKTTKKYDMNGHEIEVIEYKSEHEISKKFSHVLNTHGDVIKTDIVSYRDDGSMYKDTKRFEYQYNANGLMTEKIEYYEDNYIKMMKSGNKLLSDIYQRTVLEYDHNNNIILKMLYSENSLVKKDVFAYNNQNAQIYHEVNDYTDGQLKEKRYLKYDTNGNIIEELEWEDILTYENTYAGNGKLEKVVKYYEYDGETWIDETHQYQYDDFGNLTEERYIIYLDDETGQESTEEEITEYKNLYW